MGDPSFTGRVGELVFYDRALSPTEVSELYCTFGDPALGCTCGADNHACTLGDVFATSGLVSYWSLSVSSMDDFGANDLTEVSGPLVYDPGSGGPSTPPAGGADAGTPDGG